MLIPVETVLEMGSIPLESHSYLLNLEISKVISKYLESCLRLNNSYCFYYPPCPTWTEIIEKFGHKTPLQLRSRNGLFPKKFLRFLFKNHRALKVLIPYMYLSHHLLVHLYLLFLP